MTETFVTQCPHCRTSFRVNQAQLGAAHGVVRCGACLHVFNAAQQLRAQGHDLADTAPTQAPPASPASAAQAPAGSSAPAAAAKSDDRTPPSPANATLWIHDDLDLDSLDLDEELAKLEEQEQQLSQQFRALEQAPRYAEAFRPLSPHEPVADDEQWAEALLREDATKTAPDPSPSAPQHLPESSQAPLAPPLRSMPAPRRARSRASNRAKRIRPRHHRTRTNLG
ncbi:MJ0042-type zinc finger domain-containing protein [Pseudomonas benzenivorans]